MERQMASKTKTGFMVFVAVIFLCAMGYAQKTDKVEELTNRVKILEGQKENLDKHAELLRKEIQYEQTKSNWILVFFGFLGIGSFWGVRKYINYRVRKHSDKIVKEIFSQREKEFLEMVRRQSEEFKLKEEKSILVISQKDDSDDFMRRFFKEMGFVKVKYCTIDQIKKPIDSDLILFNNENKSISHETINTIGKESREEVFCFYFGPDHFVADGFTKRVNFANSRLQLYGNLINSLRYQSLLK